MPELKVVKQGIEPMEKTCPLLMRGMEHERAMEHEEYQGSKSSRADRACIGPQCAWFRGNVETGLCAVGDIAGWLANAFHAEYPEKK